MKNRKCCNGDCNNECINFKDRLLPIPNYPGYFLDSEYGETGYDVYSTKKGFNKLKGHIDKDGYRTASDSWSVKL